MASFNLAKPASVDSVVDMDMELPAPVLIAGAGIGGLVMALALKKHCGLRGEDIEVYESARAFRNDAGGAMGLYANGLRVLRDISPDLLKAVRESGYDYVYRRWQRHDGTEVACAREAELTDEAELQSLGIRRWKFQKALCDAAEAAGITVTFAKRTELVEPRANGVCNVRFADGTSRSARLVIGADGVKSKVREAVVGPMAAEFTGVTCLMGAAKVPRPHRGICFPSSRTTKCHGCFYPTGDNEQIFQLYFPAATMEEAWGTLSADEGTKECAELAKRLQADGWDEAYTTPLRNAEAVIRTAICAREPLHTWAAASGRIVLLGDAAHPPVPYIGQGAQMAMEDVGVLAHMLRHHCCAGGTKAFSPTDANLTAATDAYQVRHLAATPSDPSPRAPHTPLAHPPCSSLAPS